MPAFFSLNHTHISKGGKGKSVQKQAHTSAAHCTYITREGAATELLGERMPTAPEAARGWLIEQEDNDRKNARIIEKVMIALPRDEMTHEQRAGLVRDFAEQLTKGRAPWIAAIHDGARDKDNPHAHIIIRDRDYETGRRVLMASERESTENIRILWEKTCNRHLEALGLDVRIDRRTNEARGIEREAEIHVGPKSQAMEEQGKHPESKPREIAEAFSNADNAVTVDYPAIDAGRTRAQANEQIKQRNRAPTAREAVTAHARAVLAEEQREERAELAEDHKGMFGDLRRMSNRAAAYEYAPQWKAYREFAKGRRDAERAYLAKSYKMEKEYRQFNSSMGVAVIREHRDNYRKDLREFLAEDRERIFREQKERADHIYGRAKGFLSSDLSKEAKELRSQQAGERREFHSDIRAGVRPRDLLQGDAERQHQAAHGHDASQRAGFDLARFQGLRPYVKQAEREPPAARPAGTEVTDRAIMARTREITEAVQLQRARLGRIERMDRSVSSHEEARDDARAQGRSRQL